MTRSWHLVTGEFPPAPGGVSDYTWAVAAGLATAGDAVHVWCPAADGPVADPPGVQVHRSAGTWTASDLRLIDDQLEATPGPRHLLVQWVPHAYGRSSINLAFCRWVRARARAGDLVDLMVHEPFLAFREGSLRQDGAAAIHRVMVTMLLSVARRTWVSIPAWARLLAPWTFGRRVEFCWLPVPSNVPIVTDAEEVARVRAELASDGRITVGHFSTFGAHVRRDIEAIVPPLLAALPDARLLLLGRGGEPVASHLRTHLAVDTSRLMAVGSLAADRLSCHLQSCDLMVQPYSDGASTRRGTLMAALAHGLPVVTTVGRLSEPFWKSSPAVSTVASGDVDGLVKAAVVLATDPSRRRRQSAAAREIYASRFDIAHVISALRDDRCERLQVGRVGTAD